MMQATESRNGNYLRGCWSVLCRLPVTWSLLVQAKMGSVVMVVADIFGHETLQVALVKHDHMVEQIATATPDKSLRHAILPRTSEAGSLGLDAEALDRLDNLGTEIRASVKDQIFRSHLVWERLAQLLYSRVV
jgi:hypothetical protein